MNFKEIYYWNKNSYGSAKRITKQTIHSINLLLAVLVPVIYPIPIALLINRFIKKGFVWRYE